MRRLRLVYRGPEGPETLEVELEGARCVVRRGDVVERGELARLPDGRVSLLLDGGRQICGRLAAAGPGEVEVSTRGRVRRIALAEPLRDRLVHAGEQAGGQAGEEEIRALMPGRVVEVAVAAGDRVEAKALLLVLEAMKMQNEIRCARGGLVTRVAVEAGTVVEGGRCWRSSAGTRTGSSARTRRGRPAGTPGGGAPTTLPGDADSIIRTTIQ